MQNIMWRRMDVTGLEACSIEQTDSGNVISGTAILASDSGPVRVGYTVTCDRDWECRAAIIDRWVGADLIKSILERQPNGLWTANDQPIEGVNGLLDVDLGFTPATNTTAIKRLKLSVGEDAVVTALWLDADTWTFRPLRQRYVRLGPYRYKYVSVESGYEAELIVDEFGFVRVYSDLWEAVLT